MDLYPLYLRFNNSEIILSTFIILPIHINIQKNHVLKAICSKKIQIVVFS